MTKTHLGSVVTLTKDTDYTTLYDGYFEIMFNTADPQGNHYNYAYVDGVNLFTLNTPKSAQYFGYVRNALFVRKGSVIKFTGSTYAVGYFYPITS